jgi:hypothetical protein
VRKPRRCRRKLGSRHLRGPLQAGRRGLQDLLARQAWPDLQRLRASRFDQRQRGSPPWPGARRPQARRYHVRGAVRRTGAAPVEAPG